MGSLFAQVLALLPALAIWNSQISRQHSEWFGTVGMGGNKGDGGDELNYGNGM